MQRHGLPLQDAAGVELGELGEIVVVEHDVRAAALDEQALHRLALPGGLLGQPPHEHGGALRAVRDQHRLRDLGHVHRARDAQRRCVLLQRLLQAPHLVGLAVHQHHVWRLQRIQKLTGLQS